jgi:arginyl-tRNA synthetase
MHKAMEDKGEKMNKKIIFLAVIIALKAMKTSKELFGTDLAKIFVMSHLYTKNEYNQAIGLLRRSRGFFIHPNGNIKWMKARG